MRSCGAQIVRYHYKGDYVFWIRNCGRVNIYNCDGEVICDYINTGIDGVCLDFENEANDSTMLYDGIQH